VALVRVGNCIRPLLPGDEFPGAVPEPATWSLLVLGIVSWGLFVFFGRKRECVCVPHDK
jgi:hypothetical protein